MKQIELFKLETKTEKTLPTLTHRTLSTAKTPQATTGGSLQNMKDRVRDKKFITLDCGKNAITYYDGQGNKGELMSKEDFFNIPLKYPGYLIVGEDSHFAVPRTIKSKAQPFTEDELLGFYEDCANNDVMLRLFPQDSTPKALKFSGMKLGGKAYEDGDKSDENDPVAIYNFITANLPQDRVCLKKPPTSFDISPIRKWAFDERKKLSSQLCDARCNSDGKEKSYAVNGFFKDEVAEFMYENISNVAKLISPECRETFDIKVSSRGEGKVNKSFKKAQVYTILSFLMGESCPVSEEDPENYYIKSTLRERPLDDAGNKRLVSWKFAKKYLLVTSPWHRKSGVARSNLYYHGIRNFIKKKMFELFHPNEFVEAFSIPAKKDRTPEQQERFEFISKLKSDFNKKTGEEGPGGMMRRKDEKSEAFVAFRAEYSKHIRELFNAFRKVILSSSEANSPRESSSRHY